VRNPIMTTTTREILASVRISIIEPEEEAFWAYVQEEEERRQQEIDDMLWAYSQRSYECSGL
jgi:DNA polymerase IIIc chi subunit